MEDVVTKYIILFLDIDGVLLIHSPSISDYDTRLQNKTAHLIKKASYFDKTSIELLDRLIYQIESNFCCKCGIVITSFWRFAGDIEYLKQVFFQYNFSKYIIDKTENVITYEPRAQEIKKWLSENTSKLEIFNYLIIDDDEEEDFKKAYPANFICCDGQIGFNLVNFNECIQKINNTTK